MSSSNISAPVADAVNDFEYQLYCDVNTTTGVETLFLRRYETDNTGASVAIDVTLDGTTAYITTGTVSRCADVASHAMETAGCADGVPYTRRHVQYYRTTTGQPVGTGLDFYVDSAGVISAPNTPPANFLLGACPVVALAPRTPWGQDYTGTTAVTAAALPAATLIVESITVSSYIGDTTVVTGAGTITVRAGASFSWGQGTEENIDITGMTFTNNSATGSFVVHGEQRV